ncbi:hypothetical protein EVAR_21419_1 [Eumeta japonica]|uniref:Uncharacterized protein n=1 Tax=Eumeta variegata TaxID=151549 RepID=A0A4C1VIZ6_EUMVA|nr:hypothetical protein EVAR_21419_1 [Eumeta japonica]
MTKPGGTGLTARAARPSQKTGGDGERHGSDISRCLLSRWRIFPIGFDDSFLSGHSKAMITVSRSREGPSPRCEPPLAPPAAARPLRGESFVD